MVTSEATIRLERPSRYLTQLCKHAAAMGATGGGHRPRPHATGRALARGDLQVTATCTDRQGVITIAPWGRANLSASDSALMIEVTAADADALTGIQDILTRDVERFGRREQLAVTWTDSSTTAPGSEMPGEAQNTLVIPARSQRRTTVVLVVVIAAAVVVHLALGAAIVPHLRWTALTLDIAVAVIAAKLLIVAVARRALRTRHSGPRWARLHAGPRRHRPPTGGDRENDPA